MLIMHDVGVIGKLVETFQTQHCISIIAESQQADFLPYSISDETCSLIWEDPSDG